MDIWINIIVLYCGWALYDNYRDLVWYYRLWKLPEDELQDISLPNVVTVSNRGYGLFKMVSNTISSIPFIAGIVWGFMVIIAQSWRFKETAFANAVLTPEEVFTIKNMCFYLFILVSSIFCAGHFAAAWDVRRLMKRTTEEAVSEYISLYGEEAFSGIGKLYRNEMLSGFLFLFIFITTTGLWIWI